MRTITGDAILASDESLILVNAASNDVNAMVFSSVGNKKKRVTIVRIDASSHGALIIGNGGQTINGAPNLALTRQYQAVTLVADGANWLIETGASGRGAGQNYESLAFGAGDSGAPIWNATTGADEEIWGVTLRPGQLPIDGDSALFSFVCGFFSGGGTIKARFGATEIIIFTAAGVANGEIKGRISRVSRNVQLCTASLVGGAGVAATWGGGVAAEDLSDEVRFSILATAGATHKVIASQIHVEAVYR